MAHVSTPLTWSLDSTASTTISVFKDVMRAATSDNVQPLALISCEKFGATLAMCLETNKKMEDLIIKVSGPRHVKFMKAQIGYSANDSAIQLSRSLAGIQFLGLAAVLTSSMDACKGANALSEMLTASASDKTLLPTARQLKDLLAVMEHRVIRSGFSDIWVGYQILLSAALRTSSDINDYGQYKLEELGSFPASDGVSKLVEAFRQLNRLGDATTITIRAFSCAAWVMAFTRWCVGLPPSIILPDGKALLDQPASQITLFIGDYTNVSVFEISVYRSIDSPADLLKSEASLERPSSMITVQCFGRIMCHAMGGERSMAYKAMCEALPYALKQSCELLRLYGDFYFSRDPEEDQTEERRRVEEPVARHRAQPFPDYSVISSVLTEVLNLKSQQCTQRLDDNQLIWNLPLVRQHMRNLAQSCTCGDCEKRSVSSHSLAFRYSICARKGFMLNISLYTADILAISLFEDPDKLSVYHSCIQDSDGFASVIHDILKSGERTECTSWKVLYHALQLVGHKEFDRHHKFDHERWVISCYKGQAVYPKVFETGNICQPGYLALYWTPGLLFFDGEKYDRGIDRGNVTNRLETESVVKELPRPITKPLNLYPNIRSEWKVASCDDYLEIYLFCDRSLEHPSSILSNLAHALVANCPHDRASPLQIPDQSSRYIPLSLLAAHNPSTSDTGRVDILGADGNTDLRMFVMSVLKASRMPVVIRNNACLQCCLDLCREIGCHYLIC